MSKVAVMMSTYNGEKYLREQIDSILEQEEVEINLYIRDDGSSDDTVEIINDFMENNKNIELVKGKKLGVGNSFMELLYLIPDSCEYYAFSDQDDIWYPNKLSKAVNVLKQNRNLLLYASNQELVDCNGNRLGMRYSHDEVIPLIPEAEFQINRISGCTFVFTNRLKKILCNRSKRPSHQLLLNRIHDVWVANVAALYNGIYYDNNSCIKYRQHEANVVGAYSDGIVYDVKSKIKKLYNKSSRRGRSSLAYELCRCFPDKTKMHPIIDCCKERLKIKDKVYLIRNAKELTQFTKESYVGLIVKICFNLY